MFVCVYVDWIAAVFDKLIIDTAMDHDLSDRRGITETVNSVELVKNSSNSIAGSASERVIAIRSGEEDEAHVSGENKDLIHSNVNTNVLEVNDEVKLNDSKDEKNSYVVDVKCDAGGGLGENTNGERVCRICHLSSDQSLETTISSTTSNNADLIQLGCGCKGDLGIVHSHCAGAWFKLKRNRLCEICGKTAKNITGVGDNRFMEEWNEGRSSDGVHLSEGSGGCWRGQPFCNLLMACLVIAFVLPLFFRVNMF